MKFHWKKLKAMKSLEFAWIPLTSRKALDFNTELLLRPNFSHRRFYYFDKLLEMSSTTGFSRAALRNGQRCRRAPRAPSGANGSPQERFRSLFFHFFSFFIGLFEFKPGAKSRPQIRLKTHQQFASRIFKQCLQKSLSTVHKTFSFSQKAARKPIISEWFSNNLIYSRTKFSWLADSFSDRLKRPTL